MPAERVDRDARWRSRHALDAERALANGDPKDIKRLYMDMGSHLEDSFANDINGVPQLSLSETVPVVAQLLGECRGRLLDAGCGPYPATAMALARAERARTIIGLDIGIGTVRLARARSAAEGIDLLAVVGDL